MNQTIPNYNNSLYDMTLYDKVRQIYIPNVRSKLHSVGEQGRGFDLGMTPITSFFPSLIKCQQERINSRNLTLARIFQEEGVDLVG